METWEGEAIDCNRMSMHTLVKIQSC